MLGSRLRPVRDAVRWRGPSERPSSGRRLLLGFGESMGVPWLPPMLSSRLLEGEKRGVPMLVPMLSRRPRSRAVNEAGDAPCREFPGVR